MKVRILRDIELSTHAPFRKGMILENPDPKLVKNWIADGIAELVEEVERAIERKPREKRADN